MRHFLRNREWIYVFILSIALFVAVLTAAVGFSLDIATMSVLSLAVLFGSFFGELRDTWNTERQFSSARMFFRTFEWLSLAVAGYIILSVIGVNGNPSE